MVAIINNYQNHRLAQAATANVLCSVAVSASRTRHGGLGGRITDDTRNRLH